MEARIDGHTTMLALFGSPVGHSGSPAMYNYSFEQKKPHIILWDLLYKYNYFFLLLLAQTTIPITIINNGTTVIIANIILFSCSVAV